MDQLDVLNTILELTVTLISAIDAEDLDVIEHMIAQRDKQIDRMEMVNSVDPSDLHRMEELNKKKDQYLELHQQCVDKLEEFNKKIQEDYDKNKFEQLRLNKAQDISDKYHVGQSTTGTIVDTHK